MTEEMTERLEALERTVEMLCRPLADLRAEDRLIAIERALYARMDVLESRVAALESRVVKAEAEAANALKVAQGISDSRIWQTLVRASSVLARGR
jgi:Holliday junction resolvasome RuvABC endonuclease subunit